MLNSLPILKKSFKGENNKDAYLKATKWLAKNIVSNEKVSKYITYKIEIDKEQIGKVNLFLYNILDCSEEKGKFCKMCKQMHCSFFINESYNCNRCNLITFINRVESRLKVNKRYIKEHLIKRLE